MQKKKIGLTTKIFIALILGAIVGVIINATCINNPIVSKYIVNGLFYVVGQGFIRAMQMLVVPLVFCSIVCGAAAIGDTKTLGKVGVKTVLFYLFTTVAAVAVALSVANIINPGAGANLSKLEAIAKAASSTTSTTTSNPSMVDTLLNIIPTNPISALASGDMLAIIFFALIIGLILAKLGDQVQLINNFFSQGNDIMMEMTMMVMSVAPVCVFCLIARTFSTLGFSVIFYMLKYVLAVLIALLLQCGIVYQTLLKVLTGLSPIKFLKKFFPVQAFAFSTATSNATIPLSIDTLKEKMGVSKRISSFTIPLGATVNMDGTSIMQGVAVVFVAQAFGIHLSMVDYITVIATATLASIGTAGVPSVGLITLTMVFNSVGLPVAGISMIMGIDRILDMARTAVNITGDAVCTTIVAYQNGDVDKEVYNKM
ncbi:proton sodium-glutamate symporter protein [Kandleria vitulina DSM 20405]|jgi:Na+/H+-dicarboxylate symporter|uniref:Proton sodium-glutamate symporter protein n=1 Tax=Kandleria vitulina DSM 20405 TaxID=1410657 RepID=A0A0R2H4N3_9FIRM|nr:dicarboxylate/amino acid:cation symporter [Kandleria vitulina]KRN47358.1 proton sodium-glutamate symporter protein [Kandleria vitulina DSM 20405]MEE0989388.1 dicarboxylate/amino acid:cation symporter [Kandleria vitulina]SDL91429.1 Na+/H+-dicarboxylate symporter [Kandleria vitulina]SEI54445.1 Na+/H+-dicarboxylate symporter [Kandleria vitulina]